MDEVKKHMFKGRCQHEDLIAVAEGSTDEYGCKRFVAEQGKFGVKLAGG